VAEPAATGSLRVAKRFTATVGAAPNAVANLFTLPRFGSTVSGTATASATLRTGALLAAELLLHPEVMSASLVSLATLAATGTSRAASTAALRTAPRFAASATAAATAAANLTVSGSQIWPAASRTWLFDPDDTTKTTTVNGSVSQLRETSGGTQVWDQPFASSRPVRATINNRGFLQIGPTGACNLNGDAALTANLKDIYTPATYHIIWRTPSTLWGDAAVPLLGSFTTNADLPSGMMGVDMAAWNRVLADWKRTSSVNYDWHSATPTWATDRTYLLTYRRNSTGSTDFFVDGVKLGTSGPTVPSMAVDNGAASASVGGYWPVTGYTAQGVGYIGAFMRYGVAQSDATIANIASIKASRYTNTTSTPPVATSQTIFTPATEPKTTAFKVPAGYSYVVGVRFQPTVAGQITALRWYCGDTAMQMPTIRLWNSTGTQLASVTVSSKQFGWNEHTLPTAVSVTAGSSYTVSIFCPDGNITTDQTNAPLGTQQTRGNIILPANAGRYTEAATSHGNPTTTTPDAFFADVRFTPS
jgi:hypothetical protein